MLTAITTAMREATEDYNRIAEKCGWNVLDKKLKIMGENRFKRTIESLSSDLWSACRLGLIEEEEVKREIKFMRESYLNCISNATRKYEQIIGEDEYEILWVMDEHNCSREEAIEIIKEWDE